MLCKAVTSAGNVPIVLDAKQTTNGIGIALLAIYKTTETPGNKPFKRTMLLISFNMCYTSRISHIQNEVMKVVFMLTGHVVRGAS